MTSDDDKDLTIDELGAQDRHDRAQHPRAPVARAAAAAAAARSHRLLRRRARRPPRAHPGAAVRGLQPRSHQAPARGRGRVEQRGAALQHALQRGRSATRSRPTSASPSSSREWGTADPTHAHEGARRSGLVRQLPDGRFEVRSPRLAKAGRELQALGVPLERSLEFTGRRARAGRPPRADLRRPLPRDGLDAVRARRARRSEGWPAVQEALERLQPLASESLLAVFGMAMKDAVDRESAQALKRMAGDADEAPPPTAPTPAPPRRELRAADAARRARRAAPAGGRRTPTTSPTSSCTPEVARWWGSRPQTASTTATGSLEDAAGNEAFAIEVDGALAGWLGVYEEDEPDYRHGGLDIFLDARAARRRASGPRRCGWRRAGSSSERGHHRLIIDPAAANERAIAVYAAHRLPPGRRHARLRARRRRRMARRAADGHARRRAALMSAPRAERPRAQPRDARAPDAARARERRRRAGRRRAARRDAGAGAQAPVRRAVDAAGGLLGRRAARTRSPRARSCARRSCARRCICSARADYVALRLALQPPTSVALRVLGARAEGLDPDGGRARHARAAGRPPADVRRDPRRACRSAFPTSTTARWATRRARSCRS